MGRQIPETFTPFADVVSDTRPHGGCISQSNLSSKHIYDDRLNSRCVIPRGLEVTSERSNMDDAQSHSSAAGRACADITSKYPQQHRGNGPMVSQLDVQRLDHSSPSAHGRRTPLSPPKLLNDHKYPCPGTLGWPVFWAFHHLPARPIRELDGWLSKVWRVRTTPSPGSQVLGLSRSN
nr:hypothetical protein CFP56_43729 [Quercus suber]